VCGYREIQLSPKRYALVDRQALVTLLGFGDVEALPGVQRRWVDEALQASPGCREPAWSESLAVGRESFVEEIRSRLGIGPRHRMAADLDGYGRVSLKEASAPYL